MKITTQLEAELKEVMNDYWNSYLEGKLDHWAGYLVEDYRNIGGTEEEIWNSKTEILDYTNRIIDQLHGATELRNKQTQIIPYDPYIMVHELLDIYIKINKVWTFYQKFRLSSLMQKTADGWKVLHQHGSYPDSKTTEGEAIAFDTLRSENVKLQKAISERTIELEQKNNELAIEAALERVRAVAMGMRKLGDLMEICKVIYAELQALGFSELRNTLIDNFVDEENYFIDYDYSEFTGGTSSKIPYSGNPVVEKYMKDIRKSGEAFSEITVKGKQLEAWKKFRRDNGQIDDSRLNDIKALYYYKYSIGTGGIGISTYSRISKEKLNILHRFRNVFNLSYQRYTDIAQAEAQAREAQIEVSLERVRSNAMAMHKTEDLTSVVSVVFNELDKLQPGMLRCGIGILHKNKRTADVWTTAKSETGTNIQTSGDEPMDIHPLLQGDFDAWLRQEDFSYILEGKDLEDYYQVLTETNFQLPESASFETIKKDQRQYYYVTPFESGTLFAFRETEFTPEAKKVLKRFANVFNLTYKRFLDLQKAETQAREAQIEVALERVRSRSMIMQKSMELNEAAELLYRELGKLAIPIFTCGYVLIDEKTDTGNCYMANPEGSFAFEPFRISQTGNPVFRSIYQSWKNKEDYYTVVLEGEANIAHNRYLAEESDKFPMPVDLLLSILPPVTVSNSFNFNSGYLLVVSLALYTNEQNEVLVRFAKVFEQTYTRFLDLEKAEAQAEIARLSLIQIKKEKQRAEDALAELQVTQKQLIQSEKMASLGELTAGIAHEIQNPLNFVNNFSEVNTELIDELNEQLAPDSYREGNWPQVQELLFMVKDNAEKINHHGKRADAIVKGMLLHSRSSNGVKETTNINALADEYIRLSYHGLRAKDNSFHATIKTDWDESIGTISIVPQDIGRVILNLINNAFYAVAGKDDPTVSVSTKKINNAVEIKVKDNGNGIPQKVLDKIFQPFFTTKPTGEGTGLGLSLSYDIIKVHGGEIKVETREGDGTEFIIQLPAG